MATIRKRNGKWQVQVRRSGCPLMSRTFHKKADADKWAHQAEAEADRYDLPDSRKQLRLLTVRKLMERYRDTVVPRKRCRTVETGLLNALLRYPFAQLALSAVTPAAFSSFRDKRLEAVKPATVVRELGLLQHMFEVARNEWAIPLRENPLRSVRKPTLSNRRDRRLDGNEFERLLDACKKCRNRSVEPLIQLALETAMRRGELLNVRWLDMDLERRTLHIPITKNGHPRTIPLTSRAIDVLSGIPSANIDKVFPMTANAVRLAWDRVTKRASIDGLHFHDLRHEAISRFFEKGLSVPEVALISGHRDYRQLFRYTHLRPEDVARKLA